MTLRPVRRLIAICTLLAVVLTACAQLVQPTSTPVTSVAPSATPAARAPAAVAASTATADPTGSPTVAARGTARVAYAGSLVQANEQVVGPAFEQATGLKYVAVKAGGSFGVAKLIAAHQVQANVFESVGAAPISGTLVPEFTRWYVPFAASPLVIAYSPKSRYAAQLQAIAAGKKPLKDLFLLMEQPGFHLGRTNPATDPQGQAFVFMMELAAKKYDLPDLVGKALGSPTDNSQQIFAETALLAYLQSGQLDASSAFLSQALQKHLDYVALPPDINLGDPARARAYAQASLQLPDGKTIHGVPLVLYITALPGAPDSDAGVAFVHFVLSPRGKALYQQEGYQPVPSTIEGDPHAAPAAIADELRP